MKRLRQEHPFLVMDRSEPLRGDALFPFAVEDLICKQAGEARMPALHMWRHARAFIMGLRDRKLPFAAEAMAELRRKQYAVGVRHSGGAAVPLDDGVLNISLVLPKMPGDTNFHQDFARMAHLLELVLGRFGITFDIGEIKQSYCPGDYDLSVSGRKFCGIAQRRQLRAYVIQAFVIVEGEGAARGRVARAFYEQACRGLADESAPDVKPEVMVSLSEIAGRALSVADMANTVIEVIREEAGIAAFAEKDEQWNQLFEGAAPIDWPAETERLTAKLHERYNKSNL